MKKAVAYLVPFIEKEKEEKELQMRAEGTWDENVSQHLEFSYMYTMCSEVKKSVDALQRLVTTSRYQKSS